MPDRQSHQDETLGTAEQWLSLLRVHLRHLLEQLLEEFLGAHADKYAGPSRHAERFAKPAFPKGFAASAPDRNRTSARGLGNRCSIHGATWA
jgi:hypothetical protein